jgi:hypothetical protein
MKYENSVRAATRRFLVKGRSAVYHLVSRTSMKQFWLGDEEKEVFVRLMRKQAAFCGIQVLAYAVMSNHFHILARVPYETELSDGELLRRHRLMYGGDRLGPRAMDPDQLEVLFAEGGEESAFWRERLKARMGDVSVFMRELKQRFGIWFNHRHKNRGSIWSERFRSLIVEDEGKALATVAAYIDLNALRGGLVSDPSEYRFCSYGAALGGQLEARRGYEGIYRCPFAELLRSYRLCLYGKGYESKGVEGKDLGRVSAARLDEVIARRGKLELSEALRCRVRYFTDGMALGSVDFLKDLQIAHPQWFQGERRGDPAGIKGADFGELRVMRKLKNGLTA